MLLSLKGNDGFKVISKETIWKPTKRRSFLRRWSEQIDSCTCVYTQMFAWWYNLYWFPFPGCMVWHTDVPSQQYWGSHIIGQSMIPVLIEKNRFTTRCLQLQWSKFKENTVVLKNNVVICVVPPPPPALLLPLFLLSCCLVYCTTWTKSLLLRSDISLFLHSRPDEHIPSTTHSNQKLCSNNNST